MGFLIISFIIIISFDTFRKLIKVIFHQYLQYRVHDHLPLYDILNQFQKGHSHMAVVVKCKNDVNKETAEITTATVQKINK